MHVRVDEGGREQQPLALDDAVAVGGQVVAELGDDTAVDAHVGDRVELARGVENPRAADDEVRLLCLAEGQHHATASIAATLTSAGPCVSRS